MKICLVSPYDYPYPGGVTEHVKGLEKYLRLRGHEVIIMAPSSTEDEWSLGDNVRQVGNVVELPANGSKARISLSLGLSHQVQRILEEEKFDIIHLHEPLMPMLPLIVLRQSLTCNVGTFHAYGEESRAYGAARPVLRRYFDRLNAAIAVSTAARDYASQYFPGDYTVIPNGIDVARFGAPVQPVAQYRDGRPTILFVGRFEEPRKGFRVLLQALPLLRSVIPDVRLVVAGKGDPGLFVDVLPEESGVVEFAGYVSADDLPRFYQSCDVYCAPSLGQESFGIVLLEAMAGGTPVVAARNAGYAGVMTHGKEGFLFEPRSPEALAVALTRVLSDAALRSKMGAAGRATAAIYDWPLVVAKVEALYLAARSKFELTGPAPRFSLSTARRSLLQMSGELGIDRAAERIGDLLGMEADAPLMPWRRSRDEQTPLLDSNPAAVEAPRPPFRVTDYPGKDRSSSQRL